MIDKLFRAFNVYYSEGAMRFASLSDQLEEDGKKNMALLVDVLGPIALAALIDFAVFGTSPKEMVSEVADDLSFIRDILSKR